MISRLKAYKFRFYPTAAQRQQLAVEFGNARFVWNRCLDVRGKAWEERQERKARIPMGVSFGKLEISIYMVFLFIKNNIGYFQSIHGWNIRILDQPGFCCCHCSKEGTWCC